MSSADSLQILEQYAVVILPALVVAEQIGVPLPAVPALLGVGALAAHGRVSIPLVLARTSNPGAGDLQDLVIDGRPLYERVVLRSAAAFPADACGFVVGATYPEEARRIREMAPDRMFLMPGVGSQGPPRLDSSTVTVDWRRCAPSGSDRSPTDPSGE